jgi:hypothetical protein
MQHTWQHTSSSSSSMTFWQGQQRQQVTSLCSGALAVLERWAQALWALHRTLSSSSSRERSYLTAHLRRSVCWQQTAAPAQLHLQ